MHCSVCLDLHEEFMEKWYCDDFHEDEWRVNPSWKTAQDWVKAVRPLMKENVFPKGIFYPDCDFLQISGELEDDLHHLPA